MDVKLERLCNNQRLRKVVEWRMKSRMTHLRVQYQWIERKDQQLDL